MTVHNRNITVHNFVMTCDETDAVPSLKGSPIAQAT